MFENWQVTQRLSDGTGGTPLPAETRQDQRGTPAGVPAPPPDPPIVSLESREQRWCYGCGQPGHLGRYCPGDRDVPMPSAYAGRGMGPPCMLATCWTQGPSGSRTIPARVINRGHAGRTGHRQRGHPPPPRPGGRKGGETHGVSLRARGHPDLRDLPCGHPDTTRGVHGSGRDCTPTPAAAPNRDGLPNILPALGPGLRIPGQ